MKELLNKFKNKNMTRVIPTMITFIFLTSALSSGRNNDNNRIPIFVKVNAPILIKIPVRDSSETDKLLKDLYRSDSVKKNLLKKFDKSIKDIKTQQKLIDNVTRTKN